MYQNDVMEDTRFHGCPHPVTQHVVHHYCSSRCFADAVDVYAGRSAKVICATLVLGDALQPFIDLVAWDGMLQGDFDINNSEITSIIKKKMPRHY